MKKRLFVCFLMGYSLSVFAIPNYWSATYAQGYMEYGISNDKHLSVIIACNVAADDDADNSVYLYHGENLIDTHNIAFVINNEAYYIPEQTQTRSEGNMWNSFTRAIADADEFDIYVNDKPIGQFTPNSKNRLKTFTDFDCEPLHYRGVPY